MAEDLETAPRRIRRSRAAEQMYADVRRDETRGSAVGFYVLLGIVALGLLIFALVSLSRPTAPRVSPDVDRVPLAVPSAALTPPTELPPYRGVPDAPIAAPVVAVPAPTLAPAAPQNVPPGPVSPPAPAAPASVPPVPALSPDSSGVSITAPDSVPAVPSAGDATAEPTPGGTAPSSGPPDTGVATPDASASPAAVGGQARL